MSDPMQNTARRLAIRRLAVRNYRSLRDIRWPEDGLGWEGRIPDTVLVGGINGSGKTTLLETIFRLVSFLIDGGEPEELALQWLPREAEQVAALLDIGAADYAFAVGSQDLTIPPSWSEAAFGVQMPAPDVTEDLTFWPSPKGIKFYRGKIARIWWQAGGPSLLYFPTDRAVPIPFTRFKRPGSNEDHESPIYRYSAPSEWEQSVEAVLYDARWRDLNAKEGVTFLLAEQNTNIALRYSDYGYILENGRIVMDGEAKALRENEDVKEFYLGVGGGDRKSFRDVKSYKRRKRWLA